MEAEVAVIGAGAVGASVAFHLAQRGVDVLVLEKESGPATHQSGRNSGVIHAGYNLKPGSLKAQYCVQGNRELRNYCAERGVPVREGGILVVARSDQEMDVLRELLARGESNGVLVALLNEDEIKDVEPHARGVGGAPRAPRAPPSTPAHSFMRWPVMPRGWGPGSSSIIGSDLWSTASVGWRSRRTRVT